MHFGISEGKGGLKYGSCPSLCTDIFWNCPFIVRFQKISIPPHGWVFPRSTSHETETPTVFQIG